MTVFSPHNQNHRFLVAQAIRNADQLGAGRLSYARTLLDDHDITITDERALSDCVFQLGQMEGRTR